MNKILMPMMDGGIVNWEDDLEYIPGCPTCDYGSEYINDITITMTKMKIRVVLNQMYEHALSEGDLMRLILPAYEKVKNMTEDGFVAWFKENLLSLMQKNDCYVYDDEKLVREYTVQRLDGGADK